MCLEDDCDLLAADAWRFPGHQSEKEGDQNYREGNDQEQLKKTNSTYCSKENLIGGEKEAQQTERD